jgi:chromosome segregation ATPase
MLSECNVRKERIIGEVRAERTQLEMQLVVARLATAGAVANEASSRATLEATVKSAEDRTTAAKVMATSAATERESLETRLAQAEVKIDELSAAAMTANEAAEKAIAITAAAEVTTQTTAQEKTMLESKVAGLEQDLATAAWTFGRPTSNFSRWPTSSRTPPMR